MKLNLSFGKFLIRFSKILKFWRIIVHQISWVTPGGKRERERQRERERERMRETERPTVGQKMGRQIGRETREMTEKERQRDKKKQITKRENFNQVHKTPVLCAPWILIQFELGLFSFHSHHRAVQKIHLNGAHLNIALCNSKPVVFLCSNRAASQLHAWFPQLTYQAPRQSKWPRSLLESTWHFSHCAETVMINPGNFRLLACMVLCYNGHPEWRRNYFISQNGVDSVMHITWLQICRIVVGRSFFILILAADRLSILERFRCTTPHHLRWVKLPPGPIFRAKKHPKNVGILFLKVKFHHVQHKDISCDWLCLCTRPQFFNLCKKVSRLLPTFFVKPPRRLHMWQHGLPRNFVSPRTFFIETSLLGCRLRVCPPQKNTNHSNIAFYLKRLL